MSLWLDAMWGIMRRDAILFVSYRTQMVSQFLGPLFSLVVFYYISQLLRPPIRSTRRVATSASS